jgi:hypothetical protein
MHPMLDWCARRRRRRADGVAYELADRALLAAGRFDHPRALAVREPDLH